MFEQLPPHDVQAEEAVIASLMVAPESIDAVAAILEPAHFHREASRWTYEAELALHERGESTLFFCLSLLHTAATSRPPNAPKSACLATKSAKMADHNQIKRDGRCANSPVPDTDRDWLPMLSNSTRLPSRNSSFDYQAYLASREWALLKRAVRERSMGWCERCHRRAATETHHLTYRRLGCEDVSDLLHVCRPCHQYLSAAIDFDPASVCCTPAEAREWVTLIEDDPDHDPEVLRRALAHLREVEDAWSP